MKKLVIGRRPLGRKAIGSFSKMVFMFVTVAGLAVGCVQEDEIVADEIIILQLNNPLQDSTSFIVVDDIIIP